MIIPDISFSGFTIKAQELTIRQAIDIAMLPENGYFERNITKFLEFCFVSRLGNISENPKCWTIGQRCLVMSHYLAYIFSDYGFMLPVNADGNVLDDYLDTTKQNSVFTDKNDTILESMVMDDDRYSFVQLLGWHVEAIETVAENYTDWVMCAIAACIRVGDEDVNYPYDENTPCYDYGKFLIARVAVFENYPESNFIKLMAFFVDNFKKYSSFLNLWFDDYGIVATHNKEGIDDVNYQSLRFRVHDAITGATKRLSGRND